MRLDDFVLDAESGVRVAPAETPPAGYLDGVEGALAAALGSTADRSVYSAELRSHMVDWPSLYHLTPYRSTLFEAFGWRGEPARVLELGAGCGAVTRWLGEHCGEVHAVEGDPDRARVARLRTEDLENVAVYAGNFSDLEEAGRFDVATFIGVLEYGHLYHPRHPGDADASALANLRMARRSLVDDGVLVLAIENKLGMKYFNGAPEDHSARPYDGIQGYPRSTGAITWSGRELERMLAQAGFADVEFFLPFPDYKLADTIINAAAVRDEHRIHNFIGTPAPARGVDRGAIQFNETLAFREAAAAGLLVPLSNSFLVLAYAGDGAATRERLGVATDWVARHWSLDRRPAFHKVVTLHAPGGEPVVTHAPLHDLQAPDVPMRQRLGREPFARGDLALLDVMETFAIGTPDDVMLGHVQELAEHVLREHGTGRVDEEGLPLVDGAALDASWWNLVRDPADGRLQPIDLEWAVVHPLPLDYVIWRSLLYLAGRYQGHLRHDQLPADRFAGEWTGRLFPELTPERLGWFGELEMAVAAAVGAQPEGSTDALSALSGRRTATAVVAAAAEIAERPQLLRAYADAIRPGDPVVLMLHLGGSDGQTIVEAVQAAIATAGLAEGGPDMLLLAHAPESEAEHRLLAARCRAVLTDAQSSPGTDGLPRATSDDTSALAALLP